MGRGVLITVLLLVGFSVGGSSVCEASGKRGGVSPPPYQSFRFYKPLWAKPSWARTSYNAQTRQNYCKWGWVQSGNDCYVCPVGYTFRQFGNDYFCYSCPIGGKLSYYGNNWYCRG